LGSKFGLNATNVESDLQKKYMNSGALLNAQKNVGNFTFKMFDSKEDLDKYLANEKMGNDPEFESICFGFSVHEESENKFELELIFNDL